MRLLGKRGWAECPRTLLVDVCTLGGFSASDWITWLSGFSFMSFPFPFLSPRLKSGIFVMSTQASRTCVASNPLCFHLGHGYLRVLPAFWSSMLRTHGGATHLVVLPNTPEHPANSFLVLLFRGKPDFCHGPVRFQA